MNYKSFLLLLTCLICSNLTIFSQTLIASYSFENSPSSVGGLTPGTTPTYISGSSSGSDRIASSPFYFDGDSAWGVLNTNASITFSNVILTGFNSCYIKFRLASWSIASTSNGVEPSDSVHVLISTDGGVNWSSELKINGPTANNAYWGYNSGGNVDTLYDGDNTPALYTPTGSGLRTTDGYSNIKIRIPDGNSQIRIKIIMRNNSNNERWTLDQLEIYGTPSGSSNSDIISAGNEYSNIEYINHTGSNINTTQDAFKVWSFRVRDGGGIADADTSGTTLNSLIISKGDSNEITSWSNTIRKVALFNGDQKIADAVSVSDSIVFTGLNGGFVRAADGDSVTLDLYITFRDSGHTDNLRYQFKIRSSGVTATGSQFSSFSSTKSEINLDKNRIEVVASQLNFTQQPTNTVYNASMTPSVAIEAINIYGIRDLDFIQTIQLTSTGNLSGTPVSATATAGVATFSTLVHTTLGTGLYLTAERLDSGIWDINSSTFAITGNSSSDIISDGSYTYTSDLNYINWQASVITNTSQSVGVYKFIIRDGGLGGDADNLPTLLNSITFSSVSGIQNIRSAALFYGNSLVSNSPVINTTGGTIAFNGLSDTCSDNNSRALTLRVTFESHADSITDNQQMSFSITAASVTASVTGSGFGTFTTAQSQTSGNINRIEAIAVKVIFFTQPQNGSTGTPLSTFIIKSTDNNQVTDFDYNDTLILSSNGSGFSSGSPYIFSSGVKNISDIVYSSAGTGIYIIAATTGLTLDNDDTSNTFDISSVASNSYRTASSGTWPSSGSASWERFVSGTWTSSSAPSASVSDSVYIRHSISTNAAFGSTSTLFVIQNGGAFTINQNGTLAYCRVENGGSLVLQDAGLTITSSTPKNFILHNGAILNLNTNNLDNGDNFWNGNEDFQPGSEVIINNWYYGASGGLKRLLANPPQISVNSNGENYIFGKLTIQGSPSSLFGIMDGSQHIRLCENDLVVNHSGSSNVSFTTALGTTRIKGNIYVQGNPFSFAASSSSGSLQDTVDGDWVITNSATSDLNQNSSSATSLQLLLKGSILISGNGSIKSTDGGCNVSMSGSTQNISFNSTASVISDNIDYYIRSGSQVTLINANMKVGNGTDITVDSGGVFNCGFNGLTPLSVTESGGTTSFTLSSGGKLKITHADGIDKDGAQNSGNIRLDTRNFSSTAKYNYIGKGSYQRLGDGLPASSSGKNVIIELESDTTQLLFEMYNGTTYVTTGNIGISSSGEGLYIISGLIQADTNADFTGSGNFSMSGGIYKSQVDSIHSLVPQLTGTYQITGGTVELNSNHIIQRLRGGKNYHNLYFSGNNVLGSTYKSISSSVTATGKVYITDSCVVDIRSSAISGSGGLHMDGGRLRIAKVSNNQPELTATQNGQSYQLTGGTLELYGTSATQEQILRTADGNGNDIQWYNVELNAATMNTGNYNVSPNGNLIVQNALYIKSPAMLQLDANDIIEGNGNIHVYSGAGLRTPHAGGFTSSGNSGIFQNSGTRIIENGTYISYIGNSHQVAGDALPDTLAVLEINKSKASWQVDLSTPINIYDSLILQKGIVTGDSPTIHILPTARISAYGDSSYIAGSLRKTGNQAFTYPVGHITEGYHPVILSAPDHTEDAFEVTYYRNNPLQFSTSLPSGIQHLSRCEYWDIHEVNDAGLPTEIDITYTFNLTSGCENATDSQYINDLTKMRVLHFNGTNWENVGNAGVSGDDNTGTIQVTQVGSFSPFTFGSTEAPPVNPLPIKHVRLTGNLNESGKILLQLTMNLCEGNYILQPEAASEQGIFKETGNNLNTGFVPGCNESTYYFTLNENEEDIRYRVKMIHPTEKLQYSNEIYVHVGQEYSYINIGNQMLKIQGNNEIVITELSGKNIRTGYIKQGERWDLCNLPPGIYFVRNGERTPVKVIVY